MALLAAEACIHLGEAEQLAALFLNGIMAYCSSISQSGSDHVLIFDGSKAIIRVGHERIWLRVEADDLTLRLGTKTLIEAELSKHTGEMPNCLLWIETDHDPFEAITELEDKGL